MCDILGKSGGLVVYVKKAVDAIDGRIWNISLFAPFSIPPLLVIGGAGGIERGAGGEIFQLGLIK